jgi:molybdopterin-biosynthesis enzyme MoeA-like protein
MAHPMMAWVLDRFPQLHRRVDVIERSLIVQGAMEASLTPLMESIEAGFPGVKVFSLPSVDHPQWGRCIELGVKGDVDRLAPAYDALKQGVIQFGARISTELVR